MNPSELKVEKINTCRKEKHIMVPKLKMKSKLNLTSYYISVPYINDIKECKI